MLRCRRWCVSFLPSFLSLSNPAAPHWSSVEIHFPQVTELQHALAEAEQDKLLLEAQLQDVTRFEQGEQRQPADRALAGMRSELLAAANGKILELETDLLVSRQMPCTTSCAVLTQLFQPCFDSQDAQVLHSTAAFKRDQEFGVLETQSIALREELQKLSDQLAQRTVLYAAQERRWKEGSKVSCLPITSCP